MAPLVNGVTGQDVWIAMTEEDLRLELEHVGKKISIILARSEEVNLKKTRLVKECCLT
jgi:hypothetical protein